MTNPMTYEEYLERVYIERQSQWRLGQAHFNILWRYRPDLSEQIRGTLLDPFYRDEKVAEFRSWVKRNW